MQGVHTNSLPPPSLSVLSPLLPQYLHLPSTILPFWSGPLAAPPTPASITHSLRCAWPSVGGNRRPNVRVGPVAVFLCFSSCLAAQRHFRPGLLHLQLASCSGLALAAAWVAEEVSSPPRLGSSPPGTPSPLVSSPLGYSPQGVLSTLEFLVFPVNPNPLTNP